MRKLMCCVAMLYISIAMLGQATDLVIDTQNGRLSQQISEADQATVRNLKVIGNIYSSDLKFIGSLMQKKLRGIIDLSDAIIKQIDGCNPFNLISDSESCPKIRKLELPKSLEKITLVYNGNNWFDANYFQLDTLVFDTQVKTISKSITCARHLLLGENVDSIIAPIGGLIESFEIKSYPRYLDRFVHDYYNCCVLSQVILEHLAYVEHIGHTAFGGGPEYCGKRILSEIDTLNFPNIRTFYFNSFTYHSGLEVYLGSKLQEVFFNNNPDYYSADGVTFHIAAKNPPKHDYGCSWMKGNYIIMVPKESVNDYIESGWPNVHPEPVPLTAIDINPKNAILEVGETMQLIATPIPENADDVDFVWENSNEDVVKLSNTGEITALMSGEAQITVSSIDGQIKSTITVIVATHVTGITVSPDTCRLTNIGESIQLEANVLPPSATNKEVNWKSTNETVCVVVHGKVIATGYGTAVVLASTVDGGYAAECLVTVAQRVEALTLEKHELNLRLGETGRLYAQIVPANADDKTVIWSSSDDEVATVDSTGVVTAVKGGEAWIKAVSKDNAEAKDSCNVIVPDVPAPAPNGECATPTIIVMGNKMRFECETPGAEFTSYLTTSLEFTGSEVEISSKDLVYTLTVYAIAPDYDRSKPATVKFTMNRGDVNGDGMVGIGDIVEITNIMAGKE